jgi:hypothetical protein
MSAHYMSVVGGKDAGNAIQTHGLDVAYAMKVAVANDDMPIYCPSHRVLSIM